VPQDRDALQARLDAGEWLRIGAIAILTGRGRSTIQDWLVSGKVQPRYRESLGGQRSYHPDDVRALVDRVTKVHRPDAADDSGPPTTP
jgi:hypothetical protein